MLNKPQTNTIEQLITISNQCVMCALCLPHCPSYRITLNETDSPRGRIALMRAILQQDIPLTTKALQHLDQCIGCFNCEHMCPSKVSFSQLLSGTRNQLQRTTTPYQHHLIAWLLTRPRLLGYSLNLLAHTPGWIRRRINDNVNHLGQQLRNRAPASVKHFYPTAGHRTGQLQLFNGCMKKVEANNIHATIRLLNAMGYDVNIPKAQTCCGSFHQYNGNIKKTLQLEQVNQSAFTSNQLTISINSACSSQLQHNDQANKSIDILDFIQQHRAQDIRFSACHKRVAIHLPCSARNGLGQTHGVQQILQQIPDIELFELPQEGACCGAGGAYFITQDKMASQIRQPLIEQLKAIAPDILVSSNISCALHIKNGILEAGLDIEVMHPVTLLARQLQQR